MRILLTLLFFQFRTNQNYTVTLTASEPTYYQFLFPEEVTNVLLTITSDDDSCMSVSIQNLTVIRVHKFPDTLQSRF